MRNKFLLAQSSNSLELSELMLPDGMETLRLDGHSFSMIGVKTPDNIWFVADCLTSAVILEKYHVSFLYDVASYLETLTKVEQLQGELFIPAHAEPVKDISTLVELNRNKVYEIIETIQKICKESMCFEEILKCIFDEYHLVMDFNQYVLVGSTIRSYLSYLHDNGTLNIRFENNKLLWKIL